MSSFITTSGQLRPEILINNKSTCDLTLSYGRFFQSVLLVKTFCCLIRQILDRNWNCNTNVQVYNVHTSHTALMKNLVSINHEKNILYLGDISTVTWTYTWSCLHSWNFVPDVGILKPTIQKWKAFIKNLIYLIIWSSSLRKYQWHLATVLKYFFNNFYMFSSW